MGSEKEELGLGTLTPKMEPKLLNETLRDEDDDMEMTGSNWMTKADSNITAGWKAVDAAQEDLEFVPSNRGKGTILIYKGHTYSHFHTKTRWYCSRRLKGCRARLQTTTEVNIFMTARGKERLIYHDFTYYKQTRTRNGFRWGCTKNRWHKCKAYLHLADDLTVVRSNMEHTHPAFIITPRKQE
ncbi:unnamed protein product [Euphydryas editha]|uniref:FLYWCH-type domain-containing protein n=1 Tax=Euphydryas editha TaxID=104508 RepID=A0AAU9TF97_EUPED|nr:unnamed protein product [Euphydryas editha]